MAPIVVPGVCRFTVNQTLGGQVVANVLDMQVDTTGTVMSRTSACRGVAGDILNAWHGQFREIQVDNLTCVSVSWLDLDSLSGSRGVRTDTSEHQWPAQGGVASNAAMPAVVAMRIDKVVDGGRGTRHGRMYLAGVLESWTDPDTTQSWEAGAVDEVNGRAEAFLNAVTDQGINADPQRSLVVVHDVSGVAPSFSQVTDLFVNPRIATQVRRGSLR